PVAAAVSRDAGARRLAAALRADLEVRLEHAELPKRPLVLQPIRPATAIRVRRLVRAGGSPAPLRGAAVTGAAGDRGRLPRRRVRVLANLVPAGHEPVRADLARGGDLSDR